MNLNPYLIEFGHFATYLAFVIAAAQALAPLAARLFAAPRVAVITTNAAMAVFALLTIGGAALIHAFVTSDFSVLYVANNSNLQLPIFYKVAALWGGHEGSLYLWVWILSLYTLFVAWHGRARYPEHVPIILAVQGALIVGFLGLILFLSSPFERLLPAPPDGHDLNPLLQDPGMVIHPPMLYLGYVGFSVPFAFAIAALLTEWKSELWTVHIRRWTLVAWGFLTTGILLGGWWAYYELGWGGYWAWDPVENASFMPWLIGTALVHSITVQDRRRMLHAWNIFLVITTFSLSLLGTFLVRSGVLSSVHAFAVDPGRGAYILAFMAVVLVCSFGVFLVKGRYQEAQEWITSWLSRESLFVWNNVLFTFACAVVFLGTLSPLVVELFAEAKLTVAPPYFTMIMVPIFLVVMLLMAIGPLVPWRKANPAKLKRRLLVPAVIGVVSAIGLIVWKPSTHWTGPVALALALLAFGAIAIDYARALRQRRAQLNEPWPRAAVRTVLGNRRHYGGMIVHVGIVIICLGLIGSGLFRSEASVIMKPGDVVEVAGERLRFDGVKQERRANYLTTEATLVLIDEERSVTPERRLYPRDQLMTESGIDSTVLRDVYVVIGEPVDKEGWGIHVFVNPLVQLIWGGGIVVLAGLLLSLSGRRRERQPNAAAVATS